VKRVLAGLLAAATALMFAQVPVRGLATPAADELARALQKKYDTVKDFSADFQHVYTGGVLRKQLSERGRLQIKKPGKMRWEYTAPEKKTFVSDGVKIYSYIPADQQVIVTAAPPPGRTTTPALFLAGQGDLDRDFTASDAPTPKGLPEGTRTLKLVPKVAQPEFEWLILSVDPATLVLRGLASEDAQGGTSSFVFVNLKENVGIADRTFAFTMPSGVDVVTDDASAGAPRREGSSGR
jgi:outer membrane lipoprotein carrier protein